MSQCSEEPEAPEVPINDPEKPWEQITDSRDATDEERYYAGNVKYVDAARVVALPTGRFAVYDMTGGTLIAVVPAEGLSAAVQRACENSAMYWRKARDAELLDRREPRPRRGPVEEVVVAKSLGDLDL